MISLYLIADGADIAEVVHKGIDDDRDVHRFEVWAIVHSARNGIVDHADLIYNYLILDDPITAHLFAKVTHESKPIKPIEHPSNYLVDVFMANNSAHLKGNDLGHHFDRVIDLQESWRHGAFELNRDSSDGKNSDPDNKNGADDKGEPNHAPTLTTLHRR